MMKPIKFSVLLLALLTFGTSVHAEGLLRMPGDWTPFLERIDPKEFLVVENKISESLSDTCDSVYRSLGLTRLAGKGSRLEIEYHDLQSVHPEKKSVILPPDITDRLFSVIEFALTNQVYAPTDKAMQYWDGSWEWINLKIDRTRAASGRVYLPHCGMGFESSQPFWNVLYRLRRCTEKDTPEGPPLLMLDLAIDKLRLSYPAKK
jgi:hypothetical protein